MTVRPYDSDALARLQGSWNGEPEVQRFLAAAALWKPSPSVVLELGSYRMHDHDPRPAWPGMTFVGVDWREGPGVDIIGLAHELAFELDDDHLGPGYDAVLSISALEHDPHWASTLAACVRFVTHDGLVAVTCAGPGWGEHEVDCAPGGPYYRNVSIEEISETLRLASVAAGKRIVRLDAWYEERTFSPNWPRSCVLAEFGG